MPLEFVALIVGVMLVIGICQEIRYYLEVRRMQKVIDDMQNRLMSRDFRDYAGGTHTLNNIPVDDSEEMSKEEKEDLERAMDRIPIN